MKEPLLALVIFVTSSGCASAASKPSRSPHPVDRDRAIHLLSRATYGVRLEDIDTILRIGTDAWLDRQLHPEMIDDSRLARHFEYPAPPTVSVVTPSEDGPSGMTPNGGIPHLDPAITRGSVADLDRALAYFIDVSDFASVGRRATTKVKRAVYSERQLEEVMTEFWFNHFNVYHDKGSLPALLPDYEATAIRAHVFGRFEDMLSATAHHAAMLTYLDNAVSRKPAMSVEQPGRPPRLEGGINENYARELLELHTLGVDGGYTQQDVIDVARALTGWAPDGAGYSASLAFRFRADWHDADAKTVLGHTLAAGRGIEDGEDVLHILATHPSTARHVATKLVRHFVADDAPPALVDSIAAVFTRSGGDLRAVTRALFSSEIFYDPGNRAAKIKRPFEFMTSALRATRSELGKNRQIDSIVYRLIELRHLPYAMSQPTGYGSTAEEWVSAGNMINRLKWAVDLTHHRVPDVGFEPDRVLSLAGPQMRVGSQPAIPTPLGKLPSGEIAARLLAALLPGRDVARLEALLVAELERRGPADVDRVPTAIALILGSPEFQRH